MINTCLLHRTRVQRRMQPIPILYVMLIQYLITYLTRESDCCK